MIACLAVQGQVRHAAQARRKHSAHVHVRILAAAVLAVLILAGIIVGGMVGIVLRALVVQEGLLAFQAHAHSFWGK